MIPYSVRIGSAPAEDRGGGAAAKAHARVRYVAPITELLGSMRLRSASNWCMSTLSDLSSEAPRYPARLNIGCTFTPLHLGLQRCDLFFLGRELLHQLIHLCSEMAIFQYKSIVFQGNSPFFVHFQ